MRSLVSSRTFPFARLSLTPFSLFSETPGFSSIKKDIKQETAKNDQELIIIDEYKEALQCIGQQKYSVADEHLRRVKSVLESTNQAESSNYLHLIKRLAQNSIDQHKYADAESYLEMAVAQVQRISKNEVIIADHFNKLFLHCLQANLSRVTHSHSI